MLLSSSQPLTSSFSNGIKKTTWLIAPDIVLGRNLSSVVTAPLHHPAPPSLSTEKGQVSFGASVGIMTFFTTLKQKETGIIAEIQLFPPSCFIKAPSKCSHLEAFPHVEDAAFSRCSETGCQEGQDLWAATTPWSKNCFCAGSNLMPCYSKAFPRKEPSAHKEEFSIRGFSDYSMWYAPYPRGLSWSSWINKEKHLWTWESHRFVTLHLEATQTQRNASIWCNSLLQICNLLAD